MIVGHTAVFSVCWKQRPEAERLSVTRQHDPVPKPKAMETNTPKHSTCNFRGFFHVCFQVSSLVTQVDLKCVILLSQLLSVRIIHVYVFSFVVTTYGGSADVNETKV